MIKKKKEIKKSIRIFPKCKGTDVNPDFSRQTFGEQSEFNAHKCNKCGYRGIFFSEVKRKKYKY